MEIVLTKKKILKGAHLEIDLNLETGHPSVTLTYTCDKCSGYGCGRHGSEGNCDDHLNLKPEEVQSTLGKEAGILIENLCARLVDKSL